MYIKYVRRREARNIQNNKIQQYKGNTRQSKERRTEKKTKRKD